MTLKQEPKPPRHSRLFIDSGYQGIDKLHKEVKLYYKARNNKPIDKNKKAYNTKLSTLRIKLENVIAQLKTFKILSHKYRNKRKRYNLKFNIISGIVNFKAGFAHI